MTVKEVNDALSRGTKVCLVDVRTAGEYRSLHIEGSRLVPLGRFNPQVAAEVSEGAELRVLFCQGGMRAARAKEMLLGTGGAEWAVMDGGVRAWNSAGLPVVRGRFFLSLERQTFLVAGSLALLGVILGVWVHQYYLAFSAMVGLGLIFTALSGTCPMGLLLGILPWNRSDESCCAGGQSCAGTD